MLFSKCRPGKALTLTWLSCWILCPCMTAALPLSAAQKMPVSGLRMEPSVATDKKTYKLGETISLEIRVKNVSDEPVYAYSDLLLRGALAGIEIQVYDSSGHEMVPRLLAESLPDPSILSDRDRLCRLQPHHFLGTYIDVPVGRFIHRGGLYTIRVSYRSPVFPKYLSSVSDVWTREDGVLTASTDIEVRD